MFGISLRNLAVFAAVYVVVTLIMVAVLFWLATQFGFDGGSAATWIAPFAAACIMAGQSYAKARDWNWTSDERHRLALAYAVVAAIISLAFAGIYLVLDPQIFAILGAVWVVIIFVAATLLGTLILYGLGRFLLPRAVRPKQSNQP